MRFTRRYFSQDANARKHLTKFEYRRPDQRCEIVGVIQDNKLQTLQEPVPVLPSLRSSLLDADDDAG
jgi:hypothetical protein